jgi:hypothetical protein
MKKTLIEQLNADVFAALLAEKEVDPRYAHAIDRLIEGLKTKTEWYELTVNDVLCLAAFAHKIWSGNIFEVMSLFKSEPITTIKVKL